MSLWIDSSKLFLDTAGHSDRSISAIGQSLAMDWKLLTYSSHGRILPRPQS